MLIGEYQHALDAKGRVIVPSKFREELGTNFIMTRGFDGCLYGYSLSQWEKVEETLGNLDVGGKDMRAFERWFFGGAAECEIDKQGRTLIPQHLRDHAGLLKEAVIIGNRSKIEVWSKEAWDAYTVENNCCEAVAESVAGLRI